MKNGLYFDDSHYTIVLNTSCDPSKVPEQLRPLFAYINDLDRIEDEFVQAIEERVQKFAVKHHGLKSCASRMRPANDL